MVLGKLKMTASALSEILEPEVLFELLDTLFPRNNERDSIPDWRDFEWQDDWLILPTEIWRIMKKRKVPVSKAPGPDGIKATTWQQTSDEILERLRPIF